MHESTLYGAAWHGWRGILALLVPAMLSACATIFTGRAEELVFAVDPPGTKVCIEGREVGVTPMVHRTTRRRSYSIWLEKPGFQPTTVAVSKEVNPWIVANFVPLIIFPGPFGLAVDVLTGAVHKLEPTSFAFSLERDTAATAGVSSAVGCAPPPVSP